MALSAVDISKYQGAWQDYPADVVMVKISGGDQGLYIDPQAASNYNNVISSGKAFGGYHFAGGTDPIAEANYFLNAMKPWNPGEVAALDWEVSNPDPVGWCLAFVTQVHSVSGAWPLLYINLATLKAYNWTPVLNNCGLWLADWTGNPASTIDVGYKGYVMLQYSDGPNYDHDEWEYDLQTFKAYGWPTPAVTPPPTPTPEPVAQPTPEPTNTPVPQPEEPTQVVPSQTAPTQVIQQTQKGSQMKLSKLWNKIPLKARAVIHTLWQAGVAAFVTHLAAANSTAGVQVSLVASGATVLSLAKALVLKYLQTV